MGVPVLGLWDAMATSWCSNPMFDCLE